mgnify:CR=1 FL=1
MSKGRSWAHGVPHTNTNTQTHKPSRSRAPEPRASACSHNVPTRDTTSNSSSDAADSRIAEARLRAMRPRTFEHMWRDYPRRAEQRKQTNIWWPLFERARSQAEKIELWFCRAGRSLGLLFMPAGALACFFARRWSLSLLFVLIEQQSPSSSLTILIGLGDIKALGELAQHSQRRTPSSFFSLLRDDDITSRNA